MPRLALMTVYAFDQDAERTNTIGLVDCETTTKATSCNATAAQIAPEGMPADTVYGTVSCPGSSFGVSIAIPEQLLDPEPATTPRTMLRLKSTGGRAGLNGIPFKSNPRGSAV